MKNMRVKVVPLPGEESYAALQTFLCGLEGVESVEVDHAVIVRYDELKIPDEQIYAMMRAAVEMLGCRLSSV